MTNIQRPQFTENDVEIIEKKTTYNGFFCMDQYQLRYRLFEGGWSQIITRELFVPGNSAAILLFDPALNKIVLVEQFRMGALPQNSRPWLLELVAGVIEKNETPEQLVKRESMEEAGLEVQAVIPIVDYWASPGCSAEKVSLYCGRIDASQAGGVYGLAEENEDIRVRVFSVDEIYQLLAENKINNALTLIAVQWFKLNEQSIRERWSA